MEKNRVNTLIGIITVLLYFVYSLFQTLPLDLFGINYNDLELSTKISYLLVYESIFILILFLIHKNRFINDFKNYKSNLKDYIKKYFEYWAIAFGLMIISNLVIVILFPNAIANNQENVNNIFQIAPIYMIVSAVIFAPFVEETVFRLGFRNFIKNDTLFIIFSGLVFGGLHVVGSENLINYIYIIPYSIPGFIFAYTLVKSKNLFVPMSLHFFHNGFSMIMQIVLSMLV